MYQSNDPYNIILYLLFILRNGVCGMCLCICGCFCTCGVLSFLSPLRNFFLFFFFVLIILLIVGFGVIGVIIISLNSFSNDNAFTISYVHKYLYKNI